MRIQNMRNVVFTLGPFTVQESPWRFEHYSLYTVLADDVPVRRQISYPEVEDGWLGLNITIANIDAKLTTEEVEKLHQFRQKNSR